MRDATSSGSSRQEVHQTPVLLASEPSLHQRGRREWGPAEPGRRASAGLQAWVGHVLGPRAPPTSHAVPWGMGLSPGWRSGLQVHLAGAAPAGASRRSVCRPSWWGHPAHRTTGPSGTAETAQTCQVFREGLERGKPCPRSRREGPGGTGRRRNEGPSRSAGAAEKGAWDAVGQQVQGVREDRSCWQE